jgi:hypothetical protein
MKKRTKKESSSNESSNSDSAVEESQKRKKKKLSKEATLKKVLYILPFHLDNRFLATQMLTILLVTSSLPKISHGVRRKT